jgi:hypothetical protein
VIKQSLEVLKERPNNIHIPNIHTILPIKQLSEAERVAKNTPTVVKAGTTFII